MMERIFIDRIPDGGSTQMPDSMKDYSAIYGFGLNTQLFNAWLIAEKKMDYFENFGFLDEDEQLQLVAEYKRYESDTALRFAGANGAG